MIRGLPQAREALFPVGVGGSGDAVDGDIVAALVRHGLAERATDVHLEPMAGETQLRLRVDGVITEAMPTGWGAEEHRRVVARIKVRAGLDVAERRVPQDGRMSVESDGVSADVRVSTLPTPMGESVDLRILDRTYVDRGLTALGLSEEQQRWMGRALTKPVGVMLVTGPTGSGKTTTLYGCVDYLKRLGRKIISIEDPIEYETAGVTQVQVRPEVGLTFGSALRAMLRHDPDVMLVGEMRDAETAGTTMQVALTGHLVLSTLHTTDAVTAPARLVDMGIEPYLVASCLHGVIAQRLIRLVCGECRVERSLADLNEAPTIGEALRRADPAWSGRLVVVLGCGQCRGTGYWGRTGVYEILEVDEEFRSAIVSKPTVGELRRLVEKRGLVTLREDALRKAARGLTTVTEIRRVVGEESAL